MNMNWADWAVLAIMAVVGFIIPIVIGKYIDMRVRLSVKDKEVNWFRRAASIEFLLAAKLRRDVPGHALAILPDGRVFVFPGSEVAEASILGCEAAFFGVMTNRARRGMSDGDIRNRVPIAESMWRAKMGDVIVYFVVVYGKGLRNALGVDACDAAAFHVELQSVRAGAALAMQAEARRSEDGTEVGDAE